MEPIESPGQTSPGQPAGSTLGNGERQGNTAEGIIVVRDSEERRFRIQLVLSIVTLLVTPIFSGAVVHFQLTSEHGFVQAQTRTELRRTRLAERMRLQAEAVKLLAETSNLRYAYAVNNFFAEVNLVLDPAKPGKFQKPFDSSVTGMTESFNKLMQRYSELEAVLQTASVYFGPAVRTAIDKFIQNYASARVPSGPDLASIRETLIKQSGRGRVTEAGLDGTTNTLLIKPIANDSYSHLGTEINRAMTEEIQKEFESVVH